MREGGLYLHDGGCGSGGVGVAGAGEDEHLVHVGDVFFASVFEAGLVAEIVVAVGEAETADLYFRDHVGGVVEVLLGGERQGSGDSYLLQLDHLGVDALGVVGGFDLLEDGLEGF